MNKMRCWMVSATALVLCLEAPAAQARQAVRDPEAVSPLGRLLFAKAEDADTAEAFRTLETARVALDAARSDRQFRTAALGLGRALDAVWRYREAVSVYSRGLSRFADDGELLVRRGTSSTRLRNFDRALDDLRRAVRRSEESFEGHYRLGLVQFVTRDFRRAARTLGQAALLAGDDDELIAALHWGYVSSRRAGRREDADEALARVPDRMNLEQNSDYFLLIQMYFGRVGERAVYNQDAPESERGSTRGFGVGNWHLGTGGGERAREIFEIVVGGEDWPAIGVIAAEVELERMGR